MPAFFLICLVAHPFSNVPAVAQSSIKILPIARIEYHGMSTNPVPTMSDFAAGVTADFFFARCMFYP
jgi:hypothetical protein